MSNICEPNTIHPLKNHYIEHKHNYVEHKGGLS
uniref:Uncharacterized protein n=1 Tax=Anguilla anguilla TaxID=7936 RepID=A0A0E9UW03_ANGAN